MALLALLIKVSGFMGRPIMSKAYSLQYSLQPRCFISTISLTFLFFFFPFKITEVILPTFFLSSERLRTSHLMISVSISTGSAGFRVDRWGLFGI